MPIGQDDWWSSMSKHLQAFIQEFAAHTIKLHLNLSQMYVREKLNFLVLFSLCIVYWMVKLVCTVMVPC